MPKTEAIEETIYTLSDLLEEIQMVIRSTFDRSYWVIAEIVSVSEAKNGHLYLEIAEKENDFLQAKIRANIWSNAKHRILTEFEHATNQTLKKGMKVLVNGTVDFHSVFGLSLNILDIDPNFSLGEIERQKQATLKQLEEEGLIDFNKQHVIPLVLQSIAIISSESAAGYQDFKKQLSDNKSGYAFNTKLFQATMQGETASDSIVKAFDQIESSKYNFDVVVLIRGGGSSLDLSCFDEYAMAARIALSHFPVFTGVGHERDISIADRVAHTQLKTPTAVAEFILAHNQSFEQKIDDLAELLNYSAIEMLNTNQKAINNLSKNIGFYSQNSMHHNKQLLMQINHQYQKVVSNRLDKADFLLEKIKLILTHDIKIRLQQQESNLNQTNKQLQREFQEFLFSHKEKLKINENSLLEKSQNNLQLNARLIDQMEQLIHLADPIHILKKGFSITRTNGKLVRSIQDLKEHTLISTELADGIIESKINKIERHEQENDL